MLEAREKKDTPWNARMRRSVVGKIKAIKNHYKEKGKKISECDIVEQLVERCHTELGLDDKSKKRSA